MPRSKQDFAAQSEERLQSILTAALTLFALNGYDSVSIDQITKKVNCSHGLFYHYFSSKEDLFHALMKRIGDERDKKRLIFDENEKSIFILRDVTNMYLDYINGSDENAYVLYLLLTHRLKSSTPPPLCKKPVKKKTFWHYMIELVEKGQEEGVFGDEKPEDYCRAYYSCLEGLAYHRICLGKKYKPIDSNVLVNIFLKRGG